MRRNTLSLRTGCGLLIAIGSGIASAQTAPVAPVPAFAAPANVYPDTRQYVWKFYVPVLTTERLDVVVRVRAPSVRGRRLEYELPGLKSQRYKLGQVAEFSCKYADLGLPQHCSTQWHNVYVDLPVLAMQRNHIDFDVVEWRWEEQRMHIVLPHWTWDERILTISVPTFSAEDTRRAQATLDTQQAAATRAIDDGIATLDTSIAAVEAQGADPRQLATVDGTAIDLQAVRQALRDQRANELDRLANVRGELWNLAALARAAREAPGETP